MPVVVTADDHVGAREFSLLQPAGSIFGSVAAAQSRIGVFTLRGRQYLRHPRPVTRLKIDAFGQGGLRGLHHGHPRQAIFDETCPEGGIGCIPTHSVHDRNGGARGTGGVHLQGRGGWHRHLTKGIGRSLRTMYGVKIWSWYSEDGLTSGMSVLRCRMGWIFAFLERVWNLRSYFWKQWRVASLLFLHFVQTCGFQIFIRVFDYRSTFHAVFIRGYLIFGRLNCSRVSVMFFFEFYKRAILSRLSDIIQWCLAGKLAAKENLWEVLW